jgi:ATP-dependent helicase HrpB
MARDWLNASQREWVETQAPERIDLPNGRKPKVHYPSKEDPFVEIRIQDLYEVRSLPKIAMGKVELLVHILGPNMRPVQMTRDLDNFWKNQYPAVKSSLQKKYPKHEWR